ncbi:hypothetical protein UlMin_011684 [Ulmus minor]
MKLFFMIFCFTISFPKSLAADTINPNQILQDNGTTLISNGQTFELGFFSPSNSNNRYVGIWFKNIPGKVTVWVANRDNPLTNPSGILKITPTGNIILSYQSGNPIWSSNSSAKNPTLQLLNTGNLVVKEGDNGNNVWQSFDHPFDTLIPGMKFGWNLKTGQNWSLTSWSTPQDPSTGSFTYEIDPRGLPQVIQRNGSEILYRTGPWDGVRFGGDPALKQPGGIVKPFFVFDTTQVYYRFEVVDHIIARFIVNPAGPLEQFWWNNGRSQWVPLLNWQKDDCDKKFGLCGSNGVCNVKESPICHCPPGFVPKVPQDWARFDWNGGCVHRKPLNCSASVGFKKFSSLKLPYGSKFLVDRTVVKMEVCEGLCLRNCSCLAFALVGVGGCALWFEDLVDMRVYSVGGLDLHIKLEASELEPDNDGKRTVIISVSVVSAFLLFFLISGYIIWKRISNSRKSQATTTNTSTQDQENDAGLLEKDLELPLFGLDIIIDATNKFSASNKIGEGGFGPVYKGVLQNGQEIAVKKLSKDSGQGIAEFKNEVILFANLQHRNLVRLLGCCIHREDKMLIYEFMPKKSLDLYIFNQGKGTALDWQKRFDIIVGIARGLLYLHRDSRLRIIHRDLKASNILLDNEMNPKISDFGLARIFGGEQTQVITTRVVGTYGYMSPEYAIDGRFSVKSDIFSFGVMVLEIVSGKRNRGFEHHDHELNLLGHAWKLWNEGRPKEIIDAAMENFRESEVLPFIQVGLLCVQKRPEDRPPMSSVLFMLDSENPSLPQPRQPGFYMERVPTETNSSSSWNELYASTQLTITTVQGR